MSDVQFNIGDIRVALICMKTVFAEGLVKDPAQGAQFGVAYARMQKVLTEWVRKQEDDRANQSATAEVKSP